uniref:ATP synthase complex subunit 8 n=1 Tax=Tenebrionoidea sp. 1 KM-2017 TaxID=2219464 RepID=A0A346RJD6_9CUCU|nr:ATP synthase F0 subunit 8 [Tenebrionoidea sp. 1 KM-2017]
MPQMAPLNWLTLALMFILILIMFNSMNYFSVLYSPKTSAKQKMEKVTNWKW